MCSIYGAVSDIRVNIDSAIDSIALAARSRGRDGGGRKSYEINGKKVVLGNWRAVPTPEVVTTRLQPYDGIVHNGTIANDKELGGVSGEVDSMVLPRVLDTSSFSNFADSLGLLHGSFAIAAVGQSIFLACNYKPVHYICLPNGTIFFSSLESHLSSVVDWGIRPVQLKPYSAVDLLARKSQDLPRQSSRRVVVVASGGLDSTVVAAKLKDDKYDVCMLYFDYNCRAGAQELLRVKRIANALGCSYEKISIPVAAGPLNGSGTDKISGPIEGAEFANEWVPGRNLAMLSIAAAFAEANGYHYLALGNNLEEAGAYPDNEEIMTILLDHVLNYTVQNGYSLRLTSPVGHLMKHEIVKLGLSLNVPFALTWSCYRGGTRHCGKCGPCFMRREAFRRNGLNDPVMKENLNEPG